MFLTRILRLAALVLVDLSSKSAKRFVLSIETKKTVEFVQVSSRLESVSISNQINQAHIFAASSNQHMTFISQEICIRVSDGVHCSLWEVNSVHSFHLCLLAEDEFSHT